MSVKERVARVTPRQWLAVAAVTVVVVAGVVWSVVAGQARAARMSAVEEYEATLGEYAAEYATLLEKAQAVEARIPDCRSFALMSAGNVQKYDASCTTIENTVKSAFNNPETPSKALEDVEAASTEQIEAATVEVAESVDEIRRVSGLMDEKMAEIDQIIETVQVEFKEGHLRDEMNGATEAVARAREEIEKTPAGLVDQSMLDELATKATELEQMVADIEARFDEITYDEAVDQRTVLSGTAGEVKKGTNELQKARRENRAMGAGSYEERTRDRDQNEGITRGAHHAPAPQAPAQEQVQEQAPQAQAPAAPAPRTQAPAPAPAAPQGGGWVVTDDLGPGGNVCGDEFGNTWDC